MAGRASPPQLLPPPDEAVLSVTAFAGRARALLVGALAEVWVRGEISNLRRQSSGHVYFSLKDEGAQVSAVMFRGEASKAGDLLRDGQQVVAFGNADLYEARGQFQLIIRAVVDAGAGRLQEAFARLKAKLEAEGLFARERKRPIPTFVRHMGFVTSPTGAALRDFVAILRRREWTGRLTVFPARVQGDGAAAEIVEMIRLAAALPDADRPQVLVVGRGGGSIEDLWPFNEEAVCRAVAECPLPTISAVGHEIDFVLTDFAADVRAETPSAAAELLSSARLELLRRLHLAHDGLETQVDDRLTQARHRVALLAQRLGARSPLLLVERASLRLDDLGNRLLAALRGGLAERRQALGEQRMALARHHPAGALHDHRRHLKDLARRWQGAMARQLEIRQTRLAHTNGRLAAGSPRSILQRGYAIVRRAGDGRVLTQADSVRAAPLVEVELADGRVPLRPVADASPETVTAAPVGAAPADAAPAAVAKPAPRARRRQTSTEGQPELFG